MGIHHLAGPDLGISIVLSWIGIESGKVLHLAGFKPMTSRLVDGRSDLCAISTVLALDGSVVIAACLALANISQQFRQSASL